MDVKLLNDDHLDPRIHADVSTVLLRIRPMHHGLINRGEP